MDHTRLKFLLEKYFDAQLSPAEKRELEETLLAEPEARREFWLAARTHVSLRLWGEQHWGRKAVCEPVAASSATNWFKSWKGFKLGSLRSPWIWAAGMAVVALAGFAVWMQSSFMEPRQVLPVASLNLGNAAPEKGSFANSSGIAVLKHVAGVTWEKDARQYQPGDTLLPGWLRLRSGSLEIEFGRGARVVLEGPAAFDLVSTEEGRLESGRLRAYVPPPAQGFRITAPSFDLVDHGTEFGCQVPVQGDSQVYVFKGDVEVALPQPSQTKRSLKASEAVVVTTNDIRPVPIVPASFLSEKQLTGEEQSDFARRLAGWRKEQQGLSEMPHVILHYNFENQSPSDRFVRNQSAHATPATDGTLIGCDWTQGRWPGKGAVEFARSGDAIRVNVPGEFKSLTFMAWLRVDSLPNHYTSLAMTESLQVGEVHWSLTKDGDIGLGARKVPPTNPNDWEGAYARQVLKPEMAGSWVLIVSVYDAQTSTVSHYLNGEGVRQKTVSYPSVIKLGDLEIGNWGIRESDPRWQVLKQAGSVILNRSFKGRMDEFALFDTALTPEEIRAIYDYGKPAASDARLAGR